MRPPGPGPIAVDTRFQGNHHTLARLWGVVDPLVPLMVAAATLGPRGTQPPLVVASALLSTPPPLVVVAPSRHLSFPPLLLSIPPTLPPLEPVAALVALVLQLCIGRACGSQLRRGSGLRCRGSAGWWRRRRIAIWLKGEVARWRGMVRRALEILWWAGRVSSSEETRPPLACFPARVGRNRTVIVPLGGYENDGKIVSNKEVLRSEYVNGKKTSVVNRC